MRSGARTNMEARNHGYSNQKAGRTNNPRRRRPSNNRESAKKYITTCESGEKKTLSKPQNSLANGPGETHKPRDQENMPTGRPGGKHKLEAGTKTKL